MWAVEFVEQLLINIEWVAVIPPLPFSQGALVFLIFSDGGNYNLIPYVALFTCRHKYNKQTNISLLLEVWLEAKSVARVVWVLKRFSFISLWTFIVCNTSLVFTCNLFVAEFQKLWHSVVVNWVEIIPDHRLDQTNTVFDLINTDCLVWIQLRRAFVRGERVIAAHITNNEGRTI